MANLIGYVQGERGQASRTAHRSIESKLETWNGSVRTQLKADGTFEVFVGSKGSANKLVARGNVDEGWLDVVEGIQEMVFAGQRAASRLPEGGD